MKEASFYSPAEQSAVDCFLCSHRCHIGEGKRGFCRVRPNREGTLYTETYGRVIASTAEWVEKKPLYHFMPGTRSYSIATPGCNFRCPWCQNWQISDVKQFESLDAIGYVEPASVVEAAEEAECRSLCYTYTEPTIYMEYALDVARLGKERGFKNIFVTNGYETVEAVEAMTGLIDAANVDLKSFSGDFYRQYCGAKLTLVLAGITEMHSAGIHLEVTTLIIPGQNDSGKELREIAAFLVGLSPDIPWHVTRFHPDFNAVDTEPTPIETIERAVEVGRAAGLNYVYPGNVSLPDAGNTACATCGHVVIRRSGPGRTESMLEDGKCPGCGRQLPIVSAS